jgi:hypothetical protein
MYSLLHPLLYYPYPACNILLVPLIIRNEKVGMLSPRISQNKVDIPYI